MTIEKIFSSSHDDNNESMKANARRIQASLGEEASQAIIDKLIKAITIFYTPHNFD